MENALSSETSINIYQITRRHISETVTTIATTVRISNFTHETYFNVQRMAIPPPPKENKTQYKSHPRLELNELFRRDTWDYGCQESGRYNSALKCISVTLFNRENGHRLINFMERKFLLEKMLASQLSINS
jgi:hypothetical protein